MSFEARKFYADEMTAYPSISNDVLAAMATQGVKTDADTSPSIPDIQLSGSAEPAKPPENTTEQTPAPQTDTAPVVTPPVPAAEPTVPIAIDWRDQIKKVDATDILKELGYDDKMIGFFNKWKTDGNIGEYIRAVSMDYGKMTPEQLMKHQLEQSFPEFSSEDLEELYQAKVVEHYKLDPNSYSETEVKRGKLMLQADAKAIREDLQRKQQEYILSAKPPAPVADTSFQDAEAYREQQRAQYTKYLTANPVTKDLLNSKKLILGEGENAFNYEVGDPQQILTILQQPEQYARYVFNEDGSPIVDKQLFIAAAAIDHNGIINRLIKYGRDLGAKSLVDQIENAKKPTGEATNQPNAPMTPAEALAKSGIITSNS